MLTIYKTFSRSHLDYADIIYDKPFNDSFKEKLQKVQYSAARIVTRAMKSTSWERFYKELHLEPLNDKRWYRNLVFFYKIVKGLAPPYLQSYLLSDSERTYNTTIFHKIFETNSSSHVKYWTMGKV